MSKEFTTETQGHGEGESEVERLRSENAALRMDVRVMRQVLDDVATFADGYDWGEGAEAPRKLVSDLQFARDFFDTSSGRTALAELAAEICRARAKFPHNRHLLAALVEEVGELSKELLEGGPVERIRAEALQVACVAIRIAEEGDADFAQEVGS